MTIILFILLIFEARNFFRTLPRLELCSYDLDGGHNDAVFPSKNKHKFKTKDTFQIKLAGRTFSIEFQISL